MLDLNQILSTRIPDLAAVYGGVRGRTLSSHHQDNAWNVMKAAGLKQVIDLRQDYKGDRYPETCEAYGIKYFHYPVNKGRDYIANMVKDFDVFCGLIDSGDFFISCHLFIDTSNGSAVPYHVPPNSSALPFSTPTLNVPPY